MTNLGEKIKRLRKEKKLTQSELSQGKVTKNMISQIESGDATPSFSTLEHIANVLGVCVEYLVSEDESSFYFEKKKEIQNIYSAFKNSNYNDCIYIISKFSQLDDELSYILAMCYFELGKSYIQKGAINSAHKYLELALEHSKNTVFDTQKIEIVAPMYCAVAKNISSPLLEFDMEKYNMGMLDCLDYEFYKYICMDFDYNYENLTYKMHAAAKNHIKDRHYQDAIKVLIETADYCKNNGYNAYVIYGIYSDLENCYKQIYDFENAYLYSAKRMSLLEGFKS